MNSSQDYYGYAGKILRVDLSTGSIKKEDLSSELIEKYIGGMGINTKLYYDLYTPGIDPISAENPIVFGAGALDGTMTPSATKLHMTTKFPVNNAIGSAAGCGFGAMLKWSGYDHIVLTGASDKPVYLEILDDEVTLKDADALWGKDIHDVTIALQEKFGSDLSVVAIGQAGENLVKTSMAFIDDMAHIGRGGLGAVMGFKKLKAIVALGTKGIKISDRKKLLKMYHTTKEKVVDNKVFNNMRKYGLASIVDGWIKFGVLLDELHSKMPPVAETTAKYGLKRFNELIDAHSYAGHGCISCDKLVETVKSGEHKGVTTTITCGIQPHYFIPLGVPMDEGVIITHLFDSYGMDIIDGAYNIELAFKLFKDGVITEKDTGMELKPDLATLENIIGKMASGKGFWGIIADGLPRIIKEIKGVDKYVENANLKGLVASIDGRLCLGVEAFAMLTQPRGGQTSVLVRTPSTAIPGVSLKSLERLFSTYQFPQESMKRIFTAADFHVGRATALMEDIITLYNCLGICVRFTINSLYNPTIATEYYQAVTGINRETQALIKAGERTWNLLKVMNTREGFTRKDDEFPKSWLIEPIRTEKGDVYFHNYTQEKRIDEDVAKDLFDGYYDERGWDVEKGIPTIKKLEELDLKFA